MNYQEFKPAIRDRVQEALGASVNVTLQDVLKNNGTHLDGLTVVSKSCNISPTIYINHYYEEHEGGKSVDDICGEIVDVYRDANPGQNVDITFFTDYSRVRPRIVFKLVNYERNRSMLSSTPHFRYLDLAIVFQCLIEGVEGGSATILLQNHHLDYWGVTRDDLYSVAAENTPLLLNYDLRSLSDVVRDLLSGETLPDWQAQNGDDAHGNLDVLPLGNSPADSRPYLDVDPQPHPVYVLTNRKKLHGASCMLYPKLLWHIAERVQSDLFILPSSVHEVLLVPADGTANLAGLSDMVREVNASQVLPEDVLSDHVYYFSREEGRVTM